MSPEPSVRAAAVAPARDAYARRLPERPAAAAQP